MHVYSGLGLPAAVVVEMRIIALLTGLLALFDLCRSTPSSSCSALDASGAYLRVYQILAFGLATANVDVTLIGIDTMIYTSSPGQAASVRAYLPKPQHFCLTNVFLNELNLMPLNFFVKYYSVRHGAARSNFQPYPFRLSSIR